MPIKNYTTTVRPEKTASEIISLLARKGATTIQQSFNGTGELVGIAFAMNCNGSLIHFVLPVNVEGVAKAIKRDRPYSSRSRSAISQYESRIRVEAKWVAWRILKDWCEAQIAMVESNQADVAQVFLPYAQAPNGSTVYQLFLDNRSGLALGNGGE